MPRGKESNGCSFNSRPAPINCSVPPPRSWVRSKAVGRVFLKREAQRLLRSLLNRYAREPRLCAPCNAAIYRQIGAFNAPLAFDHQRVGLVPVGRRPIKRSQPSTDERCLRGFLTPVSKFAPGIDYSIVLVSRHGGGSDEQKEKGSRSIHEMFSSSER